MRNKFLSVFCCLILTVTVACSCNNSCKKKNDGKTEPNITLVENGSTEYKLLIPAAAAAKEKKAAELIAEYFLSSTGCAFDIITDDLYDSASPAKFVSVGETRAYKNSGLSVDTSALNGDGYAFKTVDGNFYIIAGDKVNSYVYAAYGFLHETIGFEAYACDEIFYNNYITLKVKEIDMQSVPSFRYRSIYNADVNLAPQSALYAELLRKDEIMWTNMGSAHNVFRYLPLSEYYEAHKNWYTGTSDKSQLCWSQSDMVEELAKKVIENVKDNPLATNVMIGQNDGTEFCTCADCTAANQKYGTPAGIVCVGVNRIAKELKKYLDENENGRKVEVDFFSYTSTSQPPVKKDGNGNYVAVSDDVILDENVGVRIAPIYTDYAYSYYDEQNYEYAEAFKGWGVLTKNINVWNYNTNFNMYFVPFNIYNSMQNNYKFMYENNVSAVMEQGAWDSYQIGFMELRNYLHAKMMWNANDDFNALMDDFFLNFYREGADYMKKYLNEFRQWYNVLEKKYSSVTGGVYTSYLKIEAFPDALLDRWEGYMTQAKESIAYLQDINPQLYETVWNRIDKETLFIDYSRLFLSKTSYGTNKLLEMRKEFKRKCEKYELSCITEHNDLKTVFDGWGI